MNKLLVGQSRVAPEWNLGIEPIHSNVQIQWRAKKIPPGTAAAAGGRNTVERQGQVVEVSVEAIGAEIGDKQQRRRRKIDEAKFEWEDKMKIITRAHDEIHNGLRIKRDAAMKEIIVIVTYKLE